MTFKPIVEDLGLCIDLRRLVWNVVYAFFSIKVQVWCFGNHTQLIIKQRTKKALNCAQLLIKISPQLSVLTVAQSGDQAIKSHS